MGQKVHPTGFRIGIIYDVWGDGRTAVKANYARYSEWQATTYAGAQNPTGTGSYYYDWVDANGDGQFQFGEQTTLRSTSLPGITFLYDEDLKSVRRKLLLDRFYINKNDWRLDVGWRLCQCN